MASGGGEYYHHGQYYPKRSSNSTSTTTGYFSSFPPFPLVFFSFVLCIFLFFTVYLSYESVLETLMEQLKMFLIVSPLLLLVVVQLLSSEKGRNVSSLFSLPDRDSIHRAGSSPWGVAVLLVFLLFMLSYKSSFQERCFPLLNKN